MIKPSSSKRLIGYDCVVDIDPQPTLPQVVLLQIPDCLTYTPVKQLDNLLTDPTEDSYLFTPYRIMREDALNGFLNRLNIALQYEAKAQSRIEQLLREELHKETEAELVSMDFDTFDPVHGQNNVSILSRASFRHELAYSLFVTLRGNGLYRNGYLFYQISKVLPTAIVLTKMVVCI